MRARRPLFTGVVIACLLLFATRAQCQTSDVEQHYQRGLELRRANDDREALEEFRIVWNAEHSVRARAQMAFAEQELGLWNVAADDIEAVHGVHDDAWADRQRIAIDDSYRAIERHFGWLDVLDAAPGAEGFVDGLSVGGVGSTRRIRVEAGRRSLEVRAPGHQPTQRVIEVLPGETLRVSMPPIPIPIPPPDNTVRWLAWSSAIGAGLAIAGGTVALVYQRNEGNAFNASPCASMPDSMLTTTCASMESTTHTDGALSVVGFATGVALGITAAVLFTRISPAARAIAGSLECGVGPGRVGAMCGVVF